MLRTSYICSLAVALSAVAAQADEAAHRAQVAQLYGAGVHSYHAGQFKEALTFLSAAADDTDDPRVYYFLGLAQKELGQDDEADASFARGAKLEAGDTEGLYNCSRALERVQGYGRVAIQLHRVKARAERARHIEAVRQARYDRIENNQPKVVEGANSTVPGDPFDESAARPAGTPDVPHVATRPPVRPATTDPGTTTPPTTDPGTTDPAPAVGQPVDDPALAYVTDDFVAALVVRPSDILGATLVTELRRVLKENPDVDTEPFEQGLANAKEISGIDPKTVERVIVLMDKEQLAAAPGAVGGLLGGEENPLEEPIEEEPAIDGGPEEIPPEAFPTVIVTFSEAVDRDAILQRLPFPLEEATHEGIAYLHQPLFDAAVYFSDDNKMVVAGRGAMLTKVLGAKGNTGPLAARLAAAGKHDLLLAVETAPLKPLIEQGGQALPPEAAGMLGMATQTKGLVVTADLSGKTLLAFHVQAANAEAAQGLATFGGAILQQGKAMYGQIKAGPDVEQLPEEIKTGLMPLVDKIVEGTSLAANGDTVTLAIPRPEGFENLASLANLLIQLGKAQAEIGGDSEEPFKF